MEHTYWINPWTFLVAQPDAQAPRTAALLTWYARVPPGDRQVCLLVCEHQVPLRDAEGMPLDDQWEDSTATWVIGCN
jgi:hypothetical protein